ncbi:MAG: DDE-type integrase/transposase/recombinase [Candidatus Hodarchaeota archaeon]
MPVILDKHSRKVFGHTLGTCMRTQLSTKVLKMALTQQRPSQGCIHHSDQGAQYAAHQYVDLLRENGFLTSMS